MPTQRETEQALTQTEGPIQKAYLEAVNAIVTAASVTLVTNALDDFDRVMDEIGLNRPALNDVLEAVRDAYKTGGAFEAPEARITFDIRNPAAEQWLREQSSQFVTRISNQQREAIRLTVESGTRLGNNPRQTALDIVGRVSKQTGRRSGGIVGLNDQQAQYVANAREQLRSGDPAEMRQYLTRSRRDRRFDGIVQRAIDQGRPVAQSDVERLVGRYSDRLLQTRGNAIAQTEALQGFSAAREQAWDQAIEEGRVDAQNITKTWRSSGDSKVRHSHAVLNRQTIKKGDLFQSSTGALMARPGDASHGARAEDIVNCRCGLQYKVDHFAEANRG